jgi:hypothetical protein
MGAENIAPTGIRSPDRPARSESLYWLRYRSPYGRKRRKDYGNEKCFSFILGFRRRSSSTIRVGCVLLEGTQYLLSDNKHIVRGGKRRSIVSHSICQVSVLSTCDWCRECMPSRRMPHYSQTDVRDAIYKWTEWPCSGSSASVEPR